MISEPLKLPGITMFLIITFMFGIFISAGLVVDVNAESGSVREGVINILIVFAVMGLGPLAYKIGMRKKRAKAKADSTVVNRDCPQSNVNKDG